MEHILSALGLPADASEDAVLKRVAELKSPKEKSASAAPAYTDAAFDAMAREAHHEVKLQSELATLREAQRASEVREILRSTDRYTTPAFETFALTKNPDEVRAMLLCLPQKPGVISALRSERVELTAADKRMCALLGTNEKAVLAHKAELVERDRNRQRRGILTGEDV